MTEEIRSDFLIIGSGIAGLSFALKAAEVGTVTVVTKKEQAESNTNYAQGGIAAVVDSDDSVEMHLEDTLNAGVGLCNREAVDALVKEGPQRLQELIQFGVEFTQKNGKLDLGREGGHSRSRIVHAQDRTGMAIEQALLFRISNHPNITLYENHHAIDLITEHHFGKKIVKVSDIHCVGVYALDVKLHTVKTFLAKMTILCTGGLGQVYLHTTNPSIATGDGMAMAYRAGAMIGNMEFVQFHPTTLFNSGSPAFLISEAVRGFGAVLKTKRGEEFMTRYDERGSLAPRDVVARAVDTELKKRGDEYVLLDLRHLQADKVKEKFPYIYETCMTKYKIDISKELIPVVPAAHYSCGGVVADLEGKTSIKNLYACGEVSMTGVHGANRLASNSLLEAIVFSHRAFLHAKESLHSQTWSMPIIPVWDESGTFNTEEWVLISHNRKEIQEIMWDYVGIVRSNARLDRAARRIRLIKDEMKEFYRRTKVTEGLIELRNLATIADIIVRSAIMRKESRGLHYTTDYPERDDKHCLGDTVISMFDDR